MFERLVTPEVIVYKSLLDGNLSAMAEKVANAGMKHRPHIKSHKSIELAKQQVAAGAIGITCSSIGEALVMSEGGIENILVAFPVIGEVNIERLTKLIGQTPSLYMSINSLLGLKNVEQAAKAANKPVGIYLEIDAGIHRGELNDIEKVIELAEYIAVSEHMHLHALQSYAGKGYGKETDAERAEMCQHYAKKLVHFQAMLAEHGIEVAELSAGSTLESFYLSSLTGITEIRSGNYIFGDMNTKGLGLISEEQCAMRVLTRVIAQQEPGKAIIDAGTKTLTSDQSKFATGHGQVIGRPDVSIFMLNEEHGFIEYDKNQPLEIGDLLEIIPNHCCVVPNLKQQVVIVNENEFSHLNIDARGIVG